VLADLEQVFHSKVDLSVAIASLSCYHEADLKPREVQGDIPTALSSMTNQYP